MKSHDGLRRLGLQAHHLFRRLRPRAGKVPLTLLPVAVFFLGRELHFGFFVRDNVSRLAHVVGGLCGILFGLRFKGEDPGQRLLRL